MAENKMPSTLNFIDVFCGAGGLSCGMEMAKWKCLLGIDFDAKAIATFEANHPKAATFCGDIHQLTPTHLMSLIKHQEVHAIIGGPPCQGFSTVGMGDPNDKRNSLFKEFYRLTKLLRPPLILIENVTGLLASKNSKTLDAVFTVFGRLGYHLDVQVMAAHLYGVPEHRRRTIIIGTRLPTPVVFPLPLCRDIARQGKAKGQLKGDASLPPPVSIGEVFKDLRSTSGEILNHDVDKAAIKSSLDLARVKCIPEGKGIRYERDEQAYLPPHLRFNIVGSQLKENRFRQTRYQRLDRRLPSPTIMTQAGSYVHPTEDRYLTVREAAAIQSFPNDFKFVGSRQCAWRQIGNAVPPRLGMALGLALRAMYKNALAHPERVRHKNGRQHLAAIRGKAFRYERQTQNAAPPTAP